MRLESKRRSEWVSGDVIKRLISGIADELGAISLAVLVLWENRRGGRGRGNVQRALRSDPVFVSIVGKDG